MTQCDRWPMVVVKCHNFNASIVIHSRKIIASLTMAGRNVCRFTPNVGKNNNRKIVKYTWEKEGENKYATAVVAMGYCLARPILCKVSSCVVFSIYIFFSLFHSVQLFRLSTDKRTLYFGCFFFVLQNTFRIILFSSDYRF